MAMIHDIIEETNSIIERILHESFEEVFAGPHIGLDERCRRLYISKDAIIVSDATNKSLRYYGGFEYIDSEFVVRLGDWVIYKAGTSRVNEVINRHYGETVVGDEYDDE
jgi:hypothetical protein